MTLSALHRPRSELVVHPAARPALELLAELGPPAGVGLGAARAVVGIPGDARLWVFGGLGWLLGDAPANASGAATVPVLMEAASDEAVAAMAWHEAAAVAALMGVPPRRRATPPGRAGRSATSPRWPERRSWTGCRPRRRAGPG